MNIARESVIILIYEQGQSIPYMIAYVSCEDSDLSAHPYSLIRVFEGHSVGCQGSKATSGGQQRL